MGLCSRDPWDLYPRFAPAGRGLPRPINSQRGSSDGDTPFPSAGRRGCFLAQLLIQWEPRLAPTSPPMEEKKGRRREREQRCEAPGAHVLATQTSRPRGERKREAKFFNLLLEKVSAGTEKNQFFVRFCFHTHTQTPGKKSLLSQSWVYYVGPILYVHIGAALWENKKWWGGGTWSLRREQGDLFHSLLFVCCAQCVCV